MRKIPLEMITADMKLGQSVFSQSTLLLRKGTSNLKRYVNKLNELDISSLYIDDEAGEGIEIPDAISEETRKKCKKALSGTFAIFQKSGNIDTIGISGAVSGLIEEITSQPNIMISLNDIGSSKDETLIHSVNTAVYGLVLANKLGMSEISQRDLAQGMLLHDIGKIALDQSILYKRGKLSQEEFEHIKQHPLIGYQILRKDPLLTEATRRIALDHHERLDGSGYAHGFQGKDLCILTRIAAIVDIYEALTVNRCYRKSFTPSMAADILTKDAADKLDAKLVALFFQSIAIYPNGNILLLSDGRLAVVKEQNAGIPFRPVVRILKKGNGKSEPGEELDLSEALNITVLEDDPERIAARLCAGKGS